MPEDKRRNKRELQRSRENRARARARKADAHVNRARSHLLLMEAEACASARNLLSIEWHISRISLSLFPSVLSFCSHSQGASHQFILSRQHQRQSPDSCDGGVALSRSIPYLARPPPFPGSFYFFA